MLTQKPNRTILINIDLFAPSATENLFKQIGKIIKEKRNDPDIRLLKAKNNLQPFSNTKTKDKYLQFDEIERYLKVYDLKKKGLKMVDIIKKIKPTAKNKDVNVQRAFYQDIERAENIIKNAGLGIFPGDYQPGGTRKLKTKT